MEKIVSIRGATTVSKNEKQEIATKTITLLNEMIVQNNLLDESISIVNLIISSTGDIDDCYPASAITDSGVLKGIPLFSTLEPKIKNSLPLCIRFLLTITCYKSFVPKHIYLNEAMNLKNNTDLLDS